MSSDELTWSLGSARPHAPRAQRSRLLVVDGNTSSLIDLPADGVLLVGRGSDTDLQVSDKSVSRHHARLFIAAGEVRIADLGSHNGVRVNGERIGDTRPLVAGDVITLGEVTLVLYGATTEPSGPRILDVGVLRKRLTEEVARALEYGRSLGVIAVQLGQAVEPAAAAQALGDTLRLIDVAGWGGAAQLVVLVPEASAELLAASAARLVTALRVVAPQAVVGVARCPHDGCDAATLIAAARDAASVVASANATASRLPLELGIGERTALVADPAMARLYELIRRLAASELPVLILGETGVGKENAAQAVHFWSRRAAGPFVAVNCAAIAESLVESELFGHEKGAFTGATTSKTGLFESAHGGTVFLDEVGELSAAVQAKLLRALETRRIQRVGSVKERDIDVRIVAATHRQLEQAVESGAFRKDLYFRISTATVVLPPLRDRPREVVLLAQRFLAAACASQDRPALTLSPAVLAALGRYDWPGNVRELKNTMEFVAVAVPDDVIEPWHLPERITARLVAEAETEGQAPAADVAAGETKVEGVAEPGLGRRKPRTGGSSRRTLADELRELERSRIVEALAASGGVKVQAAEQLGIPLRTFTLKCKQYGL